MTNQMLQNIAQKGGELSVEQREVTPEVDARSFDISEDNLTLLEGDGGELFVQAEESEIFEVSLSDSVLKPTQKQTDELEVLEVAKRDQDSVNTDTTTENTTEVVVMD